MRPTEQPTEQPTEPTPKRRGRRRGTPNENRTTYSPLKKISEEERMSLALEEALEGKSPVKSIAQKYGVRYPTLLKYCKLAREGKLPRTPSGEVCFLKRGPKFKYFDHNDRKALELFILTLDQCSLPPSKPITVRTTHGGRMLATSRNELITGFYDMLEYIMQETNIGPEHIWNADEVGISIEQRKIQLVTSRRVLLKDSSSQDDHCTVLICANAMGSLAPALYIIQSSRPDNYFSDIPNSEWVAVQPNGFIDNSLFEQ